MKKYQIMGAIALMAVMSGSIVFAAPVDKEAKAVAREDAKAAREDAIADKKVEREDTIADKKAEIEGKKVEKMCERVDKTILRLKDQSAKRKEMNADKIEKKLTQVEDKRVVQNKDLETRRQSRDQQRAKFYQQLTTKAQTDEQIDAIATFKDIVEAEIIIRRDAIDAATLAMQNAIDKLAIEKKIAVEKTYSDYKTSYDAAIATAEGTCSEDAIDGDLKNIAKDLNASLKTARAEFRAEIKNMRQVGPEAQDLAASRKAAVKEAISAFKATFDEARTELLSAFDGELDIDKDDPAPSDAGQEDSDDGGEDDPAPSDAGQEDSDDDGDKE